MSEWIECKIRDVGRVITGRTPPREHPEYWGYKVPFLTPTDMDGRRYISEPARFLSKSGATAMSRVLIPSGVGVSCIGSQMGKSVLIKVPTVTNQQINTIIPDLERVDQTFLYYVLKNKESQIFALGAGGTGIPIVNKSEFERILIPLPPLPIQREIAEILSSLDDKIDLNRRMNATLESIARALFKSWFVDFEPVRAKSEGRAPEGMDAETAVLFPDGFEDSALGEIPRGWRVGTVLDVCSNITSGGTPSTTRADYWNGDLPWLSSGETRNSFITTTEKTITALGAKESSTRHVLKGATVVASAGQGHTRGQTSLLMIDSYINQSVVALIADPNLISDQYLFLDLSRRYEEMRRISDSSSSRGSLTTKLLGGMKTVIPPHRLVSAFSEMVGSLIDQVVLNEKESRALAETRDALLPRLMRGELV